MTKIPSVFTPSTLADYWQCSPAFVIRQINSGKLDAIRIGHIWRIKPEAVTAYENLFSNQPPAPASVYVVRCGDRVKIGKAGNPQKRLAELQVGNPIDLVIVAVLSGIDGHEVEQSLHARFAHFREKGEWFRLEGELAEWINGGCHL